MKIQSVKRQILMQLVDWILCHENIYFHGMILWEQTQLFPHGGYFVMQGKAWNHPNVKFRTVEKQKSAGFNLNYWTMEGGKREHGLKLLWIKTQLKFPYNNKNMTFFQFPTKFPIIVWNGGSFHLKEHAAVQ